MNCTGNGYTLNCTYPITPDSSWSNDAKIGVISADRQDWPETWTYKTITITNPTPTPQLKPPCDSYGDTDNDGHITEQDYTKAARIIEGLEQGTTEQKRRINVDGNNQLDYHDYMLIGKYLNKEINTLPICNQPTQSPTPSPSATPISFSLEFKSEWNYFSVPLENANLTLQQLHNTCDITYIYYYDSNTGYKKINYETQPSYVLQPGTGYTTYSTKQCSIQIQGTPWQFQPKTLQANKAYLIGTPYTTTTIQQIKGTCNPQNLEMIYYKNNNGQIEKIPTTTLEPGKSYWIKSTQNCTLSFEQPPQTCEDETPYEQCSTNKPLYCKNGTLINNCTQCGCPNQTICMPDQSCCTPKTCQDLNWQCGTGPEPNCNTRINCGNCPTNHNCQNHQCTPNLEPTGTPSNTFTLNLINNWNYFSIPLKNTNLSLQQLQENCQVFQLFTFNNQTQEQDTITEPSYILEPGKGYIARPGKNCTLTLEGTPWQFQPKTLQPNKTYLIGTPNNTATIQQIKGTCNPESLTVTYFDYSTGAKQEISTTTLEPGKSYWIKSTEDCVLYKDVPPQLCEDGTLYNNCSETKPKYCDNGSLMNKCSECGCPSGTECNSETQECQVPVEIEIESAAVTPAEGQLGAILTVNATVLNQENAASAKIEVSFINQLCAPDGSCQDIPIPTEEKQLYDDGSHNDLAANDGVYGNTITAAPLNGYSEGHYSVKVIVTDKTGKTFEKETSFSISSSGGACKVILHNGNSSSKLDVVFLGDDFSKESRFEDSAVSASNYLLSLEPFKSKKDKINIYMVKADRDLKCHHFVNPRTGETTRLIVCDWSKVATSASRCAQYDKGIVLYKDDMYGGAGQGIWSDFCVSYKGLDPKVAAPDKWKKIVAHEFGHTLGLHDEYVVEEYTDEVYAHYDSSSPLNWCHECPNCHTPPFLSSLPTAWNCTTDSSCSEWSSLPGSECVKGCTFDNWHRSKSKNSMMLDANGPFSPAAAKFLEAAIDYFAGGGG